MTAEMYAIVKVLLTETDADEWDIGEKYELVHKSGIELHTENHWEGVRVSFQYDKPKKSVCLKFKELQRHYNALYSRVTKHLADKTKQQVLDSMRRRLSGTIILEKSANIFTPTNQ